MHIRGDRDFQFATDGTENFAAFAQANSAKRSYRGAVRLIVGSLENERRLFRRTNPGDLFRHSPDKLFRFNDAGPENEGGLSAADGDVSNFERLHANKRSGRNSFRTTVPPENAKGRLKLFWYRVVAFVSQFEM